MSAKYKSPSFLLPNELNTDTNTSLSEDRASMYSMDFDGTQAVSQGVGNFTSFNGVSECSVSIWFKSSTSQGPYKWFFNVPATTTGSHGFGIYASGTGLTSHVYTSSLVEVVTNFSGSQWDGNWHHLVLSYKDGVGLRFYYDSVLQFTNNTMSGTITAGGEELAIGNFSQTGSSGIISKIDEVTAFTYALTDGGVSVGSSAAAGSNVYNLYNSGSPASTATVLNLNPVVYYPLGEQAQNTGYLGNEITNGWQFPNGVLQDYVIDFDGSNQYIDAGVISALSNVSEYSISLWANIDTGASGVLRFFGNRESSGNTDGIGADINLSTSLYLYLNGGPSYPVVQVSNISNYITAGTWFNLVCTFNAGQAYIFIDGVQRGSGTGGSTADTTTNPLYIGADPISTASYFDGQISNFVLWSSDQSANIANIYNNGSPQTTYTVTPQNWWKLNADSVYTPSAPNYTTALDFDGNNDLVNANSVVSSISSSATGTVSGWIKYTTGGSAAYMITFTSNTNTSQQYLTFQGNSNGVAYAQIKNQWILQTNNAVFTSGNWYHFTVTQNGTEPKIYINGTEYSNGNGAALTTYGGTDGTEWWPDLSNFNTVTIGGMIWNSGGTVYTNYGNQDLSNISIFNSALTPSQVSTLFNFGTPETAISFSPQAWWKLNDQNAITDSSGNGNTGTNNGATAVPSGVAFTPSWKIPTALTVPTINYTSALNFDGSNTEYIDTNFTGLNNASTATISAWMNIPVFTNLYALGNLQIDGGTYKGIGFNPSTSTAFVYVNNNTSNSAMFNFNPSNYYSAGNWFNIVFVFDGSESGTDRLKVYIDKNLVTGTWSGTPLNVLETSTSNFLIGNDGQLSAPYFTGQISNTAIYNTALTPSQISTLFNSGNPEAAISFSPQAWWKLNVGGSTITDYGSGGNNGTNNGATQVFSNVYIGNIPVNGVSTTLPSTALQQSDLQFDSPYSNYSLKLDVVSYVDTNFAIPNWTKYAYSIWFKFNGSTITSYDHLIGNLSGGGNTTGRAIIGFKGTNLYLNMGDGTNYWYNESGSAAPLLDGSWHHIVLNVYETGQDIYVDGSLLRTYTYTGSVTTGTPATSNNFINKSGSAYSNNGVDSSVDEHAVFNRLLTTAEILSIYNNGKPNDISSLSPIYWWRLGENAYFNNNSFTVPNSIAGAPNGVGSGTVTTMISADAPGTYANGIGTNLDIIDRVGDASLSVANSQSYNMIPDDKVPYVPGYVGAQISNTYSMDFDGTSYLEIGSSIDVTGNTSFSYWFKADNTTQFGTVLDINSSSTTNKIWTGLYQGKIWAYTGTGNSVKTTTNYLANTWYNIILIKTSSASISHIYVNGVAETLISDSGTFGVLTTGGRIGNQISYSSYFNGQIDEVAIFDKALTADQIKFDLYSATTAGKTADIENNTNLPTPVAWYRMGD